MTPDRPVTRRAAARGALVGTAALATVGLAGGDVCERWAQVPLYSRTVALVSATERVLVRPDSDLVRRGTRIGRLAIDVNQLVAAEDSVRLAVRDAADRTGLGPGRTDLLHSAALDLHVLSFGLSAPVAGWSRNWRFVWPRDAAHAAVAFARLGLLERAAGIVRELARLCGDDGWFEARYRPGTRTSPDDRERQLDGTGWLLWGLDEVTRAGATGLLEDPDVQRAAVRATDLLLHVSANDGHLPPPSPDYWERHERRLTIGTAALTRVGLERAEHVLSRTDPRRAATAGDRAELVAAGIRRVFASSGYGRYPGDDLPDAGMLFLLPPYTREIDPDVADHVAGIGRTASRPAGGVAPGAGWKRDGVSWTPQTAMLARARLETGDAAAADRLLDWLSTHRTEAGSFPEKVLADGRPAAVAPLAWTAALVAGAVLA